MCVCSSGGSSNGCDVPNLATRYPDVDRVVDMMDPKKLPFDGMRMSWGGFKSLVEL